MFMFVVGDGVSVVVSVSMFTLIRCGMFSGSMLVGWGIWECNVSRSTSDGGVVGDGGMFVW